jgi:hypothetical protein
MPVNFIEQIFGVAPDRADGFLELLLLSIIVLLVSAVGLVQMNLSRTARSNPSGPHQIGIEKS